MAQQKVFIYNIHNTPDICCANTKSGVFFDYQTYLDGEHWNKIKNKYKNSKLPKKCRVCGGEKDLVLHHRTYKHLYRENISVHLHLVCSSCHQLIHFDENGNKTSLDWKSLTMRETFLRKQIKLQRVLSSIRPCKTAVRKDLKMDWDCL